MAKIKINGKEIEAEEGRNLVDVAKENGFEIPHYCYHPGLSIAGQCRMCVVEQEGNPKLQVACNMRCSEGLSVVTNSPKVEQVVQANLEFHLINHPIDCPICDQAGECGLQDYYMKHGKYDSQMREHKVLKEKAVDLGDKIVLDKERCILCSRCVRFTNEVSKTGDLAIFNRGDRSVIGTIDDRAMTGNYQVNTVDICPVGALTSKDFRFEQRVWFLDSNESVCSGCSKGCNVYVHHKNEKHIYRLKPRYNKDINEWWMCDEGRLTYKDSNYDRRVTASQLRNIEMPAEEALQVWASDLKTLLAMEQSDEIGVWLTAHETNESLDAILKLFKKEFQIQKFFGPDAAQIKKEDAPADGFLLRTDRYPNTHGFLTKLQEFGVTLRGIKDLEDQTHKGNITHLIVIAPEGEKNADELQNLSLRLRPDLFVVVLSPSLSACQLFPQGLWLPSLTHYEKTGTIFNHAGVKQTLSAGLKMFKEAHSLEFWMDGLHRVYRKPLESKQDSKMEMRQ